MYKRKVENNNNIKKLTKGRRQTNKQTIKPRKEKVAIINEIDNENRNESKSRNESETENESENRNESETKNESENRNESRKGDKSRCRRFEMNKRLKTKQRIKFNVKKKTSVVLISTNDFNRFIVCLKSMNNA